MSASERTVTDAACLGCGCTCDDIRLQIRDGRIVSAANACRLGAAWFGNGLVPARALKDGTACSTDTAVDAMARVLLAARSPLICIAPDVTCETQRQAVRLADALRASLDTAASDAAMAMVLAAQQRGRAGATLGEIRNRADAVVFWGVDPDVRYPRFRERYAPDPVGVHVPEGRRSRTVIAVDVGENRGPSDADIRLAVEAEEEVAALVRLSAALAAGVPSPDMALPPGLEGVALRLRESRYVAIVAEADPPDAATGGDRLRADALAALSLALNGPTRGALSLLRAGGNRSGAEAVSTWQTGYPPAIDFTRGFPRYAPWGGRASSRSSRGEIDVMLVVGDASALPATVLEMAGAMTACVIGPRASESAIASGAAVVDTGVPGVHEGGMVLRMDDVPIPVRANLMGPPDAEVITRALCERIVAVQRDARLDERRVSAGGAAVTDSRGELS